MSDEQGFYSDTIRGYHQRISALEKEVEELRKDEERLRTLRNLMGSIQGATDTTVKLFQDDATFTYHVTAGKNSYWGESLNIAIDKATAAINSAAKEDKHD